VTQALPRRVSRSFLRHERRQRVRQARARLFRGRHHTAAFVALLVVILVGYPSFPGRDVLVVSDAGARLYQTVFHGELAALPELAQPAAARTRTFESGAVAGIGLVPAREVAVSIDGRDLAVVTTAATIGGLLAESGLTLGPRDRVRLNGAATTLATPLTGVRVASASPAGTTRASSIDRPVVQVERARRFTVYVDSLRIDVQSPAATVAELVADLGLVVREADLVEPALETPLSAGMAVTLAPARTVNVVLDGEPQALYTRAATVADVLALLGLGGAEVATLSHDRSEVLAAGATLVIGTLRVVRENVREPIPPAIVIEEDPALPRGEVRIYHGQAGEMLVTYESTFRNGELERRVAVAGQVTQAPVANRKIVGTRDVGSPSLFVVSPEYTGPYRKKVNVWATWYNETHGPWSRDHPAFGLTATGVLLERGICAVDPRYIPFGTRFVVPGYGLCLAADVGGEIRGWDVDLGFPESAGSNPWRTGNVDIYILD
jgi:uncharacterized protein YabE (DUF348 family)